MWTNDVVRKVAKEKRLSQRVVSEVLSESLKQITEAVAKGEKVQLMGFGVFYANQRAESQARSFATGKPITVPAMQVPAFRAGALFKQAVRKNKRASTSIFAGWLTPKVAGDEEEVISRSRR